MKALDQSAGEISKVTEMIKLIAMQTNLLALNATIEATSAGEAGKGFAVVANEIKELANQSGKSAEDIARMVEGIQGNTRGAVAVIQEVADTIETINTASDRIFKAVDAESRSAAASAEKLNAAGQGVGHIAQSITEVAKGATDMSRNASEAAKAANDVSHNASEAARGVGETVQQHQGRQRGDEAKHGECPTGQSGGNPPPDDLGQTRTNRAPVPNWRRARLGSVPHSDGE